MQIVVIATTDLSVCPSSVTFRCFVQTNEDTIVRSSVYDDNPSSFWNGEVKFIRIFAGVTPSQGVKVKRPSVASRNLSNNQPYLENCAR